ncbi:MAG: Zn-dependent hydrolase [Actinobacteria bacterium]|jgi:N-carbamoyl-L-amino-acid hydrolase|nr:Zn-dependent hydrolase [Actinomycetota bacterium]MBT3687001.1 Zn-dependent hydrolase [Actinomycetota bacterium]MBT4037430.1 Zn-dependent hydrolase [Actinomycetota bacterium]MBT4279730.1 Zn-dependent hydrolase [Actinomycetota bacterium]MBT4342723.1 Zn-dependent hydrolase [Actinomycetota bacterium]|tara:strand:- start:437 stop:1717 length:1281 start_codon:yes stop_codon:yes gene_type:complete
MNSPCDHLRIDGDRLMRRLVELATIGPIEGGGSSRLALTDEDREGRDLVTTWMRDLGLDVRIDGIGNVVATRPGRTDGPAVMTGSHIDTVRSGGRYDGNLGVLAGLEVIETLIDAGVETEHPIAVAFFTDEEGARFPPDMLGSLVYVGGLGLEEALDIEGIDGSIVGDELDRIGYRGPHPCPGPAPHAFVELHIEQGPVLEAGGHTIGAVTGVQGISWTEFTITGQANHAGTTPMDLRHDAGWAAAAIAVHVRDMATRMGGRQVATVGRLDLAPDLVNVVAGSAVLTVDLRNTDEALLTEAEADLAAFVEGIAEAEGVLIEARTLARFEPVAFNGSVVATVASTAESLGHAVSEMPSGAGHDAQMMARICPTGMVFVPSRDGISHNPAEYTDPVDLAAGVNVLLHTLLRLDGDALEDDAPEEGETR